MCWLLTVVGFLKDRKWEDLHNVGASKCHGGGSFTQKSAGHCSPAISEALHWDSESMFCSFLNFVVCLEECWNLALGWVALTIVCRSKTTLMANKSIISAAALFLRCVEPFNIIRWCIVYCFAYCNAFVVCRYTMSKLGIYSIQLSGTLRCKFYCPFPCYPFMCSWHMLALRAVIVYIVADKRWPQKWLLCWEFDWRICD